MTDYPGEQLSSDCRCVIRRDRAALSKSDCELLSQTLLLLDTNPPNRFLSALSVQHRCAGVLVHLCGWSYYFDTLGVKEKDIPSYVIAFASALCVTSVICLKKSSCFCGRAWQGQTGLQVLMKTVAQAGRQKCHKRGLMMFFFRANIWRCEHTCLLNCAALGKGKRFISYLVLQSSELDLAKTLENQSGVSTMAFTISDKIQKKTKKDVPPEH